MATVTKCPRCNASITQSDKFCPECGTKIDWGVGGTGDLLNFFAAKETPKTKSSGTKLKCEFCGQTNKKGATFCESCGSILQAAHKSDEDVEEKFELLFNKPPSQQKIDEPVIEKKEEVFLQEKQELKPKFEPVVERKLETVSSIPKQNEKAETSTKLKQQQTQMSKTSKKKFGIEKIYIIVAVILLLMLLLYLFLGNNSSVSMNNEKQGQNQVMGSNGPTLEALQELESHVNANPNDAGAILNYANALYDAKSSHRAIEYYKKYLTINPNDGDAIVDMGICYFEVGSTDSALGVMKHAIEINPKHQKAFFNIAIVSLNSGDIKQAKEYFQKTVELDSNSESGKKAQELLALHNQ